MLLNHNLQNDNLNSSTVTLERRGGKRDGNQTLGVFAFSVVSSRLHFISVMKRKSGMKLYPRRYSNGCQPEVKANVPLKERNPSRIRSCGAQAGISGLRRGCTQQINDVAPTGWGGQWVQQPAQTRGSHSGNVLFCPLRA